MQEELDSIIAVINSHKEWSKNVRMRYAYIALGKIVHKDAMFFYTIQNNLLSKEKEDIRYSDEEVERLINTPDLFDYKVVCRNTAEMLVYILNRCGVEAEVRKTLVATIYNGIIVPHYLVIATGDEGKKYFLTLNPDLPNIQIGKKTSKFSYDVRYVIDNTYMQGGKNKGKQYYEGEEVEYSVLSDEEIRKLDAQIGYPNNLVMGDNGEVTDEYTDVFFDKLRSLYSENSDYIDYVSHQTNFYEIISKLLNGNKTLNEVLKEKRSLNKEDVFALSFRVSEITDDVWEDVKTFILSSYISKIFKEYGIRSGIDFDILLAEKRYDEIQRRFNKEISTKISKDMVNKMGLLNPYFTMKNMISIFNVIDNFEANKKMSFEDFKKNMDLFKRNLSNIAISFVDRKLLPNEGSLSSTYLTNKIIYAFNSIFDIGQNNNPFNKMGLAEQVTVIKEILEIVLSDIKKDDDLPNYDDKKSPIRNRVIGTVIFDKETKSASYLIYVKNTNYGENANMLIVYDLEKNKLSLDKTPIDIMSDYYVIRDADMKLIIEEFASGKVDEDESFQL